MRTFIFVLLLSVEVQAQTLADVARAERKRQRASEAVGVGKPMEQATVTKAATTEASVEQKLREEWVDVMKKSSALLAKLREVRDDPEVVRSIEEQLIQLTKRAQDLELQHLNERPTSRN